MSDDCPFPASPSALPRTDTCRLFFILVLSRFILFGIVINFTRIFVCAGLLAGRRARRVRGSIRVAYRTNLHRVDSVFVFWSDGGICVCERVLNCFRRANIFMFNLKSKCGPVLRTGPLQPCTVTGTTKMLEHKIENYRSNSTWKINFPTKKSGIRHLS